jgi:hypothetical protein
VCVGSIKLAARRLGSDPAWPQRNAAPAWGSGRPSARAMRRVATVSDALCAEPYRCQRRTRRQPSTYPCRPAIDSGCVTYSTQFACNKVSPMTALVASTRY